MKFSQKVLKIQQKKKITPHETRQNLLLTAPILIAPTVFSNGDISTETTSIVKHSMAVLQFLFSVFLFKKFNIYNQMQMPTK